MFQCFYKLYLIAFIANFYICVSFRGVLYWLLSPLDYSRDFLLFHISNNFLLYARPLSSGFQLLEGKPNLPWWVSTSQHLLQCPHCSWAGALAPCCLQGALPRKKNQREMSGSERARVCLQLPPFPTSFLTLHLAWSSWKCLLLAVPGEWSCFSIEGVGFTGLVKYGLPPPSWKPRMLGSVVWLLAALSSGDLNSQKGHQDWGLGTPTGLPWVEGEGKGFPKSIGAVAWGYPESHCPCDHSDQEWTPHPTSEVTFGRFETICHVWCQENWGKVCKCGLGIEEKGKRPLFWVLGWGHCEGTQGKANSDSVTIHLNGELGIPLLSLARPKAQASEIWEELFCWVWSPWWGAGGALWVVGCGWEASHGNTNSWGNTEKVHTFPQ